MDIDNNKNNVEDFQLQKQRCAERIEFESMTHFLGVNIANHATKTRYTITANMEIGTAMECKDSDIVNVLGWNRIDWILYAWKNEFGHF